MSAQKLLVLAAVSTALAVAPAGAAVAAPGPPAGAHHHGVTVVLGLTPLDGDSLDEE